MEGFRRVLDRCSLYEQPFTGDPFTWIKGRHNIAAIKERLDWCFVNNCWMEFFMPIMTSHLYYYRSDHKAISVDVLLLHEQHQIPPPRSRFRFEKLWLNDPDSTAIIQQN